MLNSAETLLERQVPGAGKLSEFPDGSRIYTAVEDETLTEIATAFGIDSQELMIINLENYSDLSLDAPLCEGTLLELPKADEDAGSEHPRNIEAGVLGWIPIFVYGSGEKAEQRTDGLLFECDKKYTVACNGREMKLSEFCQYAGNKKNRPRECIIITETQETLVDYEARRAPSLTDGYPKQDPFIDQASIPTESKEEFFAREVKIIDVPEEGCVVKVGCVSNQNRRIGLVKERKSDGWYRVVMLEHDTKVPALQLEEAEVRAYHVQQTPRDVQQAELELWSVDFLRALHVVADSFEGDEKLKLKGIQGRVMDEVAHLRQEASRSGYKPRGYAHSLVHTLNPKDWQEGANFIRGIAPRAGSSEHDFCHRVLQVIRGRNRLPCYRTPLTCRLVVELSREGKKSVGNVSAHKSVPKHPRAESNADATTCKEQISQLGDQKRELERKLAAVSEKLAREQESERALALAQDQEAAASFCLRYHEVSSTMAASHVEGRISRDLTILLRDLVAFQGASRLALRLLCVQKLLNALERDLSFLPERLRNESFIAREMTVLSSSNTSDTVDATTKWKFCAAELQSSGEYRSLTLKAAKRIQRHCSNVLTLLGPEVAGSDSGHDSKALSATFGTGSIRWHGEADGPSVFAPGVQSALARSMASSQQSKPKVPELAEAGTHSVVLKFLIPAEEYQVAWEKGCQHSRGTAWLNPLRATESLYTVSGLVPATEYRFRFRACNAGVWGEWSKAVLYSTVSESAAKCDLLTFASSELKDVPVLRFWSARNRDDDVLEKSVGNKASDTELFQKSLSLAFRRLHTLTVTLIEKLEAAARSSEAHGPRSLSWNPGKPRLPGSFGLAGGSSNTTAPRGPNELALTPAQLLAASRPPQAAMPLTGLDPTLPTTKKPVDTRVRATGGMFGMPDAPVTTLFPTMPPGSTAARSKPVHAFDTRKEIERLQKRPKTVVMPSGPQGLPGHGLTICSKCKHAPAVIGATLCPQCTPIQPAKPIQRWDLPGLGGPMLDPAAALAVEPVAAIPLTNAQRRQLGAKLAARLHDPAADDVIVIDPPASGTEHDAGKKREGGMLDGGRPAKR